MKIVFLGTGVGIARKERASPGLLVEIGGENLLFDCGPGTIKTLVNLGCDVSQLSNLFITHFHIDHVNDYPALVKDRRFTTKKQLNVYGPVGLNKHTNLLFKQIFRYMGPETDLNAFEFLKLKEVSEGVVEEKGNWKVTCTSVLVSNPIVHGNAIAYRIYSGNKSLLYSGDTGPSDNLIKLGKNVNVAIIECSYPDEQTLKGDHLIPSTVGKTAQEMKAKKLFLTHLYPVCRGKEDNMIEEVKKYFDGEVIIAKDLMEVEI